MLERVPIGCCPLEIRFEARDGLIIHSRFPRGGHGRDTTFAPLEPSRIAGRMTPAASGTIQPA